MRNQELHPRTEIINKHQKNHSKNARNKALGWLAARFPKAFNNTISIQPLKLGIMNDILTFSEEAEAAGISKSKLREAVVVFTRRIDYLTALKAREMRIDLNGNPVEPVSEEDAERATAKIKKRVEKSAKNARKKTNSKASGYSHPTAFRATPQTKYTSVQTANSYGEEREYESAYSNHSVAQPTPAVVVKHKSSRHYDPDAVARLKEKLGLSRKKELVD